MATEPQDPQIGTEQSEDTEVTHKLSQAQASYSQASAEQPEAAGTTQHVETVEESVTLEVIQTTKSNAKTLETGAIEHVETIEKEIETSKVVQRIETIEKEVETSKIVQRIETFEKEVQAIKDVQIAEKEAKTFEEFLLKFNNDWSLSLSGALAYTLLSAIFPIAIVLLSTFGLFPGTREFLINQILKAFPVSSSTANGIRDTVFHRLPTTSGILWVLVILIAIFTGSRLFALIDSCFNIIYQVHSRSYLRQTRMAIGMFLLFIVLIPIMVFSSSAPALLISLSPLNNLPDGSILFSLGGIIGSLAASIVLFSAIYVIVPNQHISIRNSWRGTVVAALLLQIYLLLFPLYVTHFFTGYDATIGGVIILLAFFYYFAIILFLGAEVNAFYAEGKHAAPSDLATLVHSTTSGATNSPAAAKPAVHEAVPPA